LLCAFRIRLVVKPVQLTRLKESHFRRSMYQDLWFVLKQTGELTDLTTRTVLFNQSLLVTLPKTAMLLGQSLLLLVSKTTTGKLDALKTVLSLV